MSEVVVYTRREGEIRYEDNDTDTYTFEIGQSNGVLLITRTTKADSVISVPDEEECVRAYSSGLWEVWRE